MVLISLFTTSGIFSRVNCLYLFVEDIHQAKKLLYISILWKIRTSYTFLLAVSAESLENSDDHKYYRY